jgi:threonine/homoserine/homoserine lactone efflux protein
VSAISFKTSASSFARVAPSQSGRERDVAAWQQFLVIAGAHFLALVSPGPDFFLIVRSAVVNGPRTAGGVCVGIAVANAVYIALAIAGVSLLQTSALFFSLLKWGGCGYLAWIGWRFVRSSGELAMPVTDSPQASPSGWWRECRTGFLSGILNPKNSLFYSSLFSLGFDAATPPGVRLAYGLWMFAVVLLWDLAVARAAGHPPLVRRFRAHIRMLERLTGAVLLAIAAAIAGAR